MDGEHLVEMANDISHFFAGASAPGKAAEDVAGHIRRLWDPRMRRQIVAIYASGKGAFDPVARAAVALIAAGSPPPA
jgi:formate dehydrogenase subunit delta